MHLVSVGSRQVLLGYHQSYSPSSAELFAHAKHTNNSVRGSGTTHFYVAVVNNKQNLAFSLRSFVDLRNDKVH